MKSSLTAAAALLAFAASAYAQSQTPNQVVAAQLAQGSSIPINCTVTGGCPGSGVGDDGNIWCTGASDLSGNPGWFTGGELNCYIVTGANPAQRGYLGLTTNQLLKSNGNYAHANCTTGLNGTADVYVPSGYGEYNWPFPSFSWEGSQNATTDHNEYVWLGWWTPAPMEPYSVYTITTICPPKTRAEVGP